MIERVRRPVVSSAVRKPAASARDFWFRRRAVETLLTVSAPILVLGLWEWLARSGRIDARFWPAPSTLIEPAGRLFDDGLVTDIRLSLLRIAGGFFLGAVPGVLLGLAMGLFWPVRVFVMPLAAAIYAIPKLALLPLVLIAFGLGETANLVIVAISIFFLVVLNTMGGVLAIDTTFRDVARNLGATRWELITTVAFPGALPAIFTGLRLALGFALVVIVGTEFVRTRDGGVGALIWESWQTLAIKKMYVGLFVTGLMGWLLTVLVDLVERWAVPWRAEG